MGKPGLPGIGYWWRFSAYEIRDMTIGPSPGAQLEQYDPWEKPKAYESLLDLARTPRLYPPTQEAERQILDWVTNHGLLGVLPHEMLMMTLPLQWLPLPGLGDGNNDSEDDPLFPTAVSHIRTSTGWTLSTHVVMSHHVKGTPERKGSGIEPDVFSEIVGDRRVNIPSAQVMRRPLGSDQLRFEDTDSLCHPFFRSSLSSSLDDLLKQPPRGVYPQPLSDEFWLRYCEPLPYFLSAADELRSSLEGLAKARPGMPPQDAAIAWQARRRLHALLASISPILHGVEDGILQQRWASTSLLATLAMQAYLDLTADGRVLICICGRIFISTDRRAAHCSERCRWRAHQRAYRNRQAQRKSTTRAHARKGGRR